MAKALFACDELSGLIVACALVTPDKSLQSVEVASVKKKMKRADFARNVNREDIVSGAAELGVAVETFRRSIEPWHDYFLLAGTAAATLMGLLFVSLSIHLEKVVHERGKHLEAMARESCASFVIVLALSLMMLAPELARRSLGGSLIILAGVRATMTVFRMRQMLSPAARRGFGGRNMVVRFLFPLLAVASLAWAGTRLLAGDVEDAMVGIMSACLLLIADATRSAYELLVRTARVSKTEG
jgi:hypothetical protein